MNRGDHSTWNSCIDVSSWITLCWVRGTRYYRVHLEQDLWSNWLFTQVNGRVGSPLGRARLRPARSIEDALFELAAIAQRRRKRGYRFKSRINLSTDEGDQ
jgi:hypothetical protein